MKRLLSYLWPFILGAIVGYAFAWILYGISHS
jgi:hypothetical protein